jgi:ATP-dependent Lon protease
VKEKVLAAHRIGLKTVLLPTRNQVDLEDVPDEVREEIQFVFTDSVRDAIDAALMPVDKKKFKKSKKKQNGGKSASSTGDKKTTRSSSGAGK